MSLACPDPAEHSNICQWVVENAAAILLTMNMSYAAEQSPCRCISRARKVPARALCSTNSARPRTESRRCEISSHAGAEYLRQQRANLRACLS